MGVCPIIRPRKVTSFSVNDPPATCRQEHVKSFVFIAFCDRLITHSQGGSSGRVLAKSWSQTAESAKATWFDAPAGRSPVEQAPEGLAARRLRARRPEYLDHPLAPDRDPLQRPGQSAPPGGDRRRGRARAAAQAGHRPG